MSLPVSGKTYRINCVGASGRRLNLWINSGASVANEMNVVLWSSDSSAEQDWTFSGDKFLTRKNTSFALDRFTGSSASQNACVYVNQAQWDKDQKLAFELVSGTTNQYRIKLRNEARYLTAVSNANGTSTGKSTTSAGNVYFAPLNSSNTLQRWTFTEVATTVTPPATGNYRWPTESKTITNPQSSTHLGIDIGPKTNRVPGDKIYAYMAGYVSAVLNPTGNPSEGYSVRIHHNNPLNNGYARIRTQYMHMTSNILVTAGQQVTAGQLIGYMGNSGNVSPKPTSADPGAGTHLHFEVRGGTATEFSLGGTSTYATGTVLTANSYLALT